MLDELRAAPVHNSRGERVGGAEATLDTSIDAAAIARDTAALVQAPSLTGDERPALERLGELAAALGLDAELHEYDLAALRAHPDHPGEEAPRDELLGLTVSLPGSARAASALTAMSTSSTPARAVDHEPVSGPSRTATCTAAARST